MVRHNVILIPRVDISVIQLVVVLTFITAVSDLCSTCGGDASADVITVADRLRLTADAETSR
jgi:hypothetical protein